MSYPINYPTPQGANIQIFQLGGSVSDWVKPQGASFVWFTLIGAGGGADTYGGGSAAVTNFMGPAFLMPDSLRVNVGAGGSGGSGSGAFSGGSSTVVYQAKDGTGYALLTANGGGGGDASGIAGVGGAASTSNFFSACGFFQSVAGQSSSLNSNISASATTFLSAGATGDTGSGGFSVTPNYGYPTTVPANPTRPGYFQMQPVIVGCGGAGGNAIPGDPGNPGGNGGVGCGGGGRDTGTSRTAPNGNGGDGLVVIITW